MGGPAWHLGYGSCEIPSLWDIWAPSNEGKEVFLDNRQRERVTQVKLEQKAVDRCPPH